MSIVYILNGGNKLRSRKHLRNWTLTDFRDCMVFLANKLGHQEEMLDIVNRLNMNNLYESEYSFQAVRDMMDHIAVWELELEKRNKNG